jgi:hypothetical protein
LYFCATKASNLSTCQIQKLAGARLAICRGTAVRAQAAGTADFFRKRIKEGENERRRRGLTTQFRASQLAGGFRKEDFWQAF